MKYKLEITAPENELDRIRTVIDAELWLAAVQEYDEWLRQQIKHHGKPYDDARRELYLIIRDRGLKLYD